MYSVKNQALSLCMLLIISNIAIAMTDPMQPPSYRSSKQLTKNTVRSGWRLTSTLVGNDRRLATINGKTLGVGKKINGAIIRNIQPAVVTLDYQNRSIVLKLLPSAVKRQRHIGTE